MALGVPLLHRFHRRVPCLSADREEVHHPALHMMVGAAEVLLWGAPGGIVAKQPLHVLYVELYFAERGRMLTDEI
jgi:hypothetical protein